MSGYGEDLKRIKNHGIVFYDGECEFCLFWTHFILKKSVSNYFRYASFQSQMAEKLCLDLKNVNSILFYENGIMFKKSTAMIKISKYLKWPWKGFRFLSIIPSSIRDFVYDRIAENRYLFSEKVSPALKIIKNFF